MIFGGGDVGYNYYLCDGPIGAPVGGACRFNDDCNAGASCVTNTHCECFRLLCLPKLIAFNKWA